MAWNYDVISKEINVVLILILTESHGRRTEYLKFLQAIIKAEGKGHIRRCQDMVMAELVNTQAGEEVCLKFPMPRHENDCYLLKMLWLISNWTKWVRWYMESIIYPGMSFKQLWNHYYTTVSLLLLFDMCGFSGSVVLQWPCFVQHFARPDEASHNVRTSFHAGRLQSAALSYWTCTIAW